MEPSFAAPARVAPAHPARNVLVIAEPPLKRVIDLGLAGFMLLCSAPIWLIVWLAIKLEDGGPLLFEQERWGRGGTTFRVRKFRTMVQNAGLRPAERNDRRVTQVGRFLRACGMDELPQLLNIWRGEMSFVGPRALAVGEKVRNAMGELVEYESVPGFWDRLAVRPGLTSVATIFIAKDSPPRRKFRYDLFYIRRLSVPLDVYLILLSFWISFRGKWESRERKL